MPKAGSSRRPKFRRSTGFLSRFFPERSSVFLAQTVRPTSGQAWIGEHDVWQEQARVKLLIGVVPQRPNLDFSLTAREILIFHAAYFGIGHKQRNEHADALLEKFKLTERANQMVRGFSGGMMQRLSI